MEFKALFDVTMKFQQFFFCILMNVATPSSHPGYILEYPRWKTQDFTLNPKKVYINFIPVRIYIFTRICVVLILLLNN